MDLAICTIILVGTVTLALWRPRVFGFELDYAAASLLGAMAMLLSSVVPWEIVVIAEEVLIYPVITIAALMVVTAVCEDSGVFGAAAIRLAILCRGNGRWLFTALFFSGCAVGMVFTNDAAVLIFTPMVYTLVEKIKTRTWTEEHRLPFYFAVLSLANLVGAIVIANPVNLVVAQRLGISFTEFASAMVLPSLACVVVTYGLLIAFFGGQIPRTYRIPNPFRPSQYQKSYQVGCCTLLAVTLIAFFSEPFTHWPIWAVAVASAIGQVLLYRHFREDRSAVTFAYKAVSWELLVFVVGMFVVASGFQYAGLGEVVATPIREFYRDDLAEVSFAMGYGAAFLAAVINNHPTADFLSMVLGDLAVPLEVKKHLAYSLLIGADMGPKMLPIGSLAALLWFGLLRQRGVKVRYGLYVRIGLPVALTGIGAALVILNL